MKKSISGVEHATFSIAKELDHYEESLQMKGMIYTTIAKWMTYLYRNGTVYPNELKYMHIFPTNRWTERDVY